MSKLRQVLILLMTALFTFLSFTPGVSIERGTLAEGNPYSAPIEIKTAAGVVKGCTGTVLTPRIVATAAHCLIDENGISHKEVRVGSVGGKAIADNSWKIMDSFFTISGYKSASTVQFNDIAIIVLREPLEGAKYFEIPSEDIVLAMKRDRVALTLYGYGTTSDQEPNGSLLPSSLPATYSGEWSATMINSGYAQSSPGDTCSGDSGGPVIAKYSGRDYVIGIINGEPQSNYCTKIESGGYFTSFTLLNRYSNLLAMATNAASVLEVSTSYSQIEALMLQVNSSKIEIEKLRQEIADAKTEIAKLKLKIPTSIKCIKGSVVKKVIAVNPKCPTGYKKV